MKLKNLVITTASLFIISVTIHIYENIQGKGLISGSDYIKGLNPSDIHKIVLIPSKKEQISFIRERKGFLIESHKSFPASNAKINDLIYKIASIQISEEVSKDPSEEELKKHQLLEEDNLFKIIIFDNNKEETVSFYVGKKHKRKGNYLYKKSDDYIYLSNAFVSFPSSYKDFIDTNLMRVNAKQIERISLASDKNMEMRQKDGKYLLLTPKSKFDEKKIESYFKNFT
ncbi:MAG: DUF4340 domain-containing protein, partial [Halobacteriovoraceae bacterium]|nr:DUF4340 domain-containing protein [Halobacteriovoraceae bacterium]